MIIQAEKHEGKLYVLTAHGEVWRLEIEFGIQPILQCMGEADSEQMRRLAGSQLARLFP